MFISIKIMGILDSLWDTNICLFISNLFCCRCFNLLNLRNFIHSLVSLETKTTPTAAEAKNNKSNDTSNWWGSRRRISYFSVIIGSVWSWWIRLVIFNLISTSSNINISSNVPSQFSVIEASWIICFYPTELSEPSVWVLTISMHDRLTFAS